MIKIIITIISALYLFLPAGIANLIPVLLKNFQILNSPVDFGKKLNGKRILGDHKTWRGVIGAILIAIVVILIQKQLYLDYPLFRNISSINYVSEPVILIGFLLGFGAILGDMIESYFKRKNNILPGKPWIPFDQLDYVVSGLLFLLIAFRPSVNEVVIIIIAYPLLHILVNHIGYYLKINKSKW